MTTRSQNPESGAPVLILTISNGAAHTRAGESIAAALRTLSPELPAMLVDVADYMDRPTRFTHITAYLWMVKHAPALWDRIDRYQKRQPRTSPEWYYRRGCRALFDLARRVRPRALVATEVGCGEIASLIRRDLQLNVPLVAVNLDYEADRAWVRPETNLYTVPCEQARAQLIAHGAQPERIEVWGVPMAAEFDAEPEFESERRRVCRMLNLRADEPIVLVAGGSEGLGRIEEAVARLLGQRQMSLQVIVLAGRNAKLKRSCERIGQCHDSSARLRVTGWTNDVPSFMRAADLMVSKLGNTFDEAIASRLPLVSLEPPPGSERVQYRLLDEWGVGRAVRTMDELTATVKHLLSHDEELRAMRRQADLRRRPEAAKKIAGRLLEQIEMSVVDQRSGIEATNDPHAARAAVEARRASEVQC